MELIPRLAMDQAARYRIVVQGWISERWLEWCEGMDLSHLPNEDSPLPQTDVTILTGIVLDQSALLGLIQRLFTLGFPLLVVEYLPRGDETEESKE